MNFDKYLFSLEIKFHYIKKWASIKSNKSSNKLNLFNLLKK